MNNKISKGQLIYELKEVIYKWCREYDHSYEEAITILDDMFKERKRIKNKVNDYKESDN